jgi:hypothetical protein
MVGRLAGSTVDVLRSPTALRIRHLLGVVIPLHLPPFFDKVTPRCHQKYRPRIQVDGNWWTWSLKARGEMWLPERCRGALTETAKLVRV